MSEPLETPFVAEDASVLVAEFLDLRSQSRFPRPNGLHLRDSARSNDLIFFTEYWNSSLNKIEALMKTHPKLRLILRNSPELPLPSPSLMKILFSSSKESQQPAKKVELLSLKVCLKFRMHRLGAPL